MLKMLTNGKFVTERDENNNEDREQTIVVTYK